jgi:putative transposase
MVQQVIHYIETQEEHHQRMTFADELRELLRRHEMEWDERYFLD